MQIDIPHDLQSFQKMTQASFVLFLLYLHLLLLFPRLHPVRLDGGKRKEERDRERQRQGETKTEKALCIAGPSLHLTLEQRRGFGWKQEVIAMLV